MNILLSAANKLAFLLAPIFYKLLFMAITASCIGLIVFLIRKLTDGKIAPVWKMALWSLMIVALIVPYRPQSRTAILPAAPVEVSYREAYDEARYEAFMAIQDESLPAEQYQEIEDNRDKLYLRSLVVDVLLPLTWFGGVVLCGGLFTFSAVCFSRRLKGASRAADSRCKGILDQCREQLAIRRSVPVIVVENLASPAVWGLLNPTILLPTYAEELSDRELRCILLHELSHWKRGDLLKNGLLLLLQSIYWFDPLLPWLFRSLREDLELLNDAAVLRHLGEEEGSSYSRALVDVLARSSGLSPAPRLLCMCDEGKNMQRRIRIIQRRDFFRKKRLLIAVAAFILILCLSLLFLTQPRSMVHQKLHFPATEQAPGFVLSIETEGSWTVKNYKPAFFHNHLPPADAFYGARYLYDEQGECIGWIFAQNFTPYEEMTFPDENYYQTVFPELRLGSFRAWDPFTSVKISDTGEVGTCAISFHDMSLLASSLLTPQAAIPVLESKGILAYDVELGVYVGIGFSSDFEIGEEEVRSIAKSLSINAATVDETIDLSPLQMGDDNICDPVIAQGLLDSIQLEIHGDYAAVGWTTFGIDRMGDYDSVYVHVLYRTFNIADGVIDIVNSSSHYAEITLDLRANSGPAFGSYKELPKGFDPKRINPDFVLTDAHLEAEQARIQADMDAYLAADVQQAPENIPVSQRFRTPLGDVPDFSNTLIAYPNGDIVSIRSNYDNKLLELTEDNWVYVTCNGYAYMDDGSFYFSTDGLNASDRLQYSYEKYSVGHRIIGPGYDLTMTQASTAFFNEYANGHFPYFEGCSAVFEGNATLTGFCLMVDEGDFLYGEGDLLFLPDEDSGFIPVMGDGLFSGGEDPVLTYSDGISTYYSGNGRELYFGNIADYPDLDFSFLEAGRYKRVRIEVDRLLIRKEQNLSYGSSARIREIQPW